MSQQLEYKENFERGFCGMLADSGKIDSITGVVEPGMSEAQLATVKFGFGVAFGSEERAIQHAAGGTLAGLLIHRHIELGEIKETMAFAVLRKGRMWVEPAVAVAVGEPVHILADGTISNTGGTAVGTFLTATAAADELAVADINMPQA